MFCASFPSTCFYRSTKSKNQRGNTRLPPAPPCPARSLVTHRAPEPGPPSALVVDDVEVAEAGAQLLVPNLARSRCVGALDEGIQLLLPHGGHREVCIRSRLVGLGAALRSRLCCNQDMASTSFLQIPCNRSNPLFRSHLV